MLPEQGHRLESLRNPQEEVADEIEKHQAGLTDRTDWLPVDMKLSLK